MFRKHFFLFFAALILIAVIGFGVFKMVTAAPGGAAGGAGGATAAAGAGRGGAPGAGGRAGAAGRGGRGGGTSQVSAATATPHTFSDYVEVLGVAKARQSVTITASASELVTNVLFRAGQDVTAGQTLLELKSQSEDAAISTATANLSLARLNAQRYNILAAQGAAAQSVADQYNAALTVAQAQLSAAQAAKMDRVIRAPFAGRVGLSDIAPGALISPGTPITTLDDLTLVKVDFAVPDRYIALLKVGSAITAQADALGGAAVRGRIAQIDTRIDEKTRTLTARAEFPNPDRAIRAGMLMRVGIASGMHQGVAIPESAIQLEDQQAIVYVLTPGDRGTTAERTEVTIGGSDGNLVDVTSGLRAGQLVVADGLDKVTPGGVVRVVGSAGGRGGRGGGGGGGRGGRAGAGAPTGGVTDASPAGAGGGRRGGGARSGGGAGRRGGAPQ